MFAAKAVSALDDSRTDDTQPTASPHWQVRSVQAAERRADQELDRLMGDIGALLLDEPSPGPDWSRTQSAVP